jgi:hypothetical protein
MNIYYPEKTRELKLHQLYKLIPKGDFENTNIEPTHAVLVYINKYFETGEILIFDNTHSFVILDDGSIHRFRYESDVETIDYTIDYEIECYKPYEMK